MLLLKVDSTQRVSSMSVIDMFSKNFEDSDIIARIGRRALSSPVPVCGLILQNKGLTQKAASCFGFTVVSHTQTMCSMVSIVLT